MYSYAPLRFKAWFSGRQQYWVMEDLLANNLWNRAYSQDEVKVFKSQKNIRYPLRYGFSPSGHRHTHTQKGFNPDSLHSHSKEWCHSRVVCVYWNKAPFVLLQNTHSLWKFTWATTRIKKCSNQNKTFYYFMRNFRVFYFLHSSFNDHNLSINFKAVIVTRSWYIQEFVVLSSKASNTRCSLNDNYIIF